MTSALVKDMQRVSAITGTYELVKVLFVLRGSFRSIFRYQTLRESLLIHLRSLNCICCPGNSTTSPEAQMFSTLSDVCSQLGTLSAGANNCIPLENLTISA